MLNADLQAAISTAIQAALAPVVVLNVDLMERLTYEGDEVVDVTVLLPSNTGPLPPVTYLQAMADVSRTLLAAADERMPLFRTMREGERETAEEEAAAAP